MTQGGGHAQYVVPSGLSYTKQLLPHAPYKDPEGALITAWRPGHWSNWGFEIGKSTDTAFDFARGGFQGGRGNHQGAEWFISGVKEELDVEREFWYDAKQATLYYVSATEPPKTGFEHAQLLKLFDIKGTQATPVTGVIFSGLAFSECSNGRPGLGCDCCATLMVDGCCEQLARRRRSWSRMGFRAAGTGRCRGRRRFSSRGRKAARSTAACCSGWTATPSCSPATTRCPPSLICPMRRRC